MTPLTNSVQIGAHSSRVLPKPSLPFFCQSHMAQGKAQWPSVNQSVFWFTSSWLASSWLCDLQRVTRPPEFYFLPQQPTENSSTGPSHNQRSLACASPVWQKCQFPVPDVGLGRCRARLTLFTFLFVSRQGSCALGFTSSTWLPAGVCLMYLLLLTGDLGRGTFIIIPKYG